MNLRRRSKLSRGLVAAGAEFNRGNCLVMLGKYEPAIERYDRALELDPDFEDARINRDVAIARAKLVERKGGEMGDQKVGADEITFDKSKNAGGQDTETEASRPLSDAELQALWLRRIQTRPADFLKSKFAYQLCSRPADRRRQVMEGLIRPWVMLCCICLPSVSAAAEIVRAEIGKETAWTGEAVPLIVTLYSPGPFSGTASFDLPRLPRTVIRESWKSGGGKSGRRRSIVLHPTARIHHLHPERGGHSRSRFPGSIRR